MAFRIGCAGCAPTRRHSAWATVAPTQGRCANVRHAARIFHQWLCFAACRRPWNRRLVWVNFDETSIPFAFRGIKGYVTRASNVDSAGPNAHTEQLGTCADRGSYTLLGFISNYEDIQRRLPRILIGKKNRLSRRIMHGASERLLDGLHVWSRPSAWVNQDVMIEILRRLALCWQDIHREIYPILILDCAPQHISTHIVEYAYALGIGLVFVPKHLTFLLQPLDVMVFTVLKRELRAAWTEARTRAAGGEVDVETHLQLVAQCANSLLATRNWCRAFDLTGITNGRRNIAHSLQSLLDAEVLDTSADPPTAAELQFISSATQYLPHTSLILKAPFLSTSGAHPAVASAVAARVPRAHRLHAPALRCPPMTTPRDPGHRAEPARPPQPQPPTPSSLEFQRRRLPHP